MGKALHKDNDNLRLNSAATKEGPARNLTEIFVAIFITGESVSQTRCRCTLA